MKTAGKIIVIGGSAGSLDVILALLPLVGKLSRLAVVIVLHRKNSSDSTLRELLAQKTRMPVREVEDKDAILPGGVFIAPADYHLLIENNFTFSLDVSEKVNYSRPSIDISFRSAAEVYGPGLTCILLSGANADGAEGLVHVKKLQGTVIVQDPATARVPFMPEQALAVLEADHVTGVEGMAELIRQLDSTLL